MSKFSEINERIEKTVTDGYKKIEDGVVEGYKKVEDGVVSGYKKIEDRFIGTFLTREGESIEEARVRLNAQEEEK